MKAFCVLLLSFFSFTALAQQNQPVWVMVEQAERHIDNGDFGLAIRQLRESLAIAPEDADALFAMGRAYKAISDYTIAQDYFSRALSNRQTFAAPQRSLLVRYERADIHRVLREFARYEQELQTILQETVLPEAFLPERLMPIVAREGVDRMLVLYRVPEDGGTQARSMLGELLVGLGRYAQAGELLSVSVIQALTTVVEAVRRRDPLYEYTSVAALLEEATRYDAIADYLQRTTLFADLYFLAAAYLGEGRPYAVQLWRVLADLPGAGSWAGRASRQVDDPQVEPLIVPGR